MLRKYLSKNNHLVKESISCVLLCLFSVSINGQVKGDYQWIFASNASELPGHEGTVFDFNGDSLQFMYHELPKGIRNNNASLADEEGKLLFYTNGCEVFDASFQLMENGGQINPGEIHDEYCPYDIYVGTQNSMIIPDPGNLFGYYYFHKKLQWIYEPVLDAAATELTYTYISFQQNPLGEVTDKNVIFDSGPQYVSGFGEIIKHKNDKDWWLIEFTYDTFGGVALIFLVDEVGINLSHEIPVENPSSLDLYCSSSGQSCFSPNGELFAKNCPLTGLDVYDFDRSTGMLSNYRNLDYPSSYGKNGLSISPNSRFAYISTHDTLFQVDLWEPNLADGLVLIDTFDLFGDPFGNNFTHQQLGPDCRIYMNSTNGTRHIHVIDKPNEKGLACDFRQHGIELPHYISAGSLPNFPHFRVNEDEVCDPSISSLFGLPIQIDSPLKIFPNPGQEILNVEGIKCTSFNCTVKAIDGHLVYKEDFNQSESTFVIETQQWVNGIYIVSVICEDGNVYSEKWLKM